MTDKKDNNLRKTERDLQEEKKNKSIVAKNRVPNEQHRLKDQENIRK